MKRAEALKVAVFDDLLLVGQNLELLECLLELLVVERVAQLMQALFERMAAGMLAQNDSVLRNADGLRGHDFVGLLVRHDAVLMDAGLVCERIRADNGLGRGNGNAGDGLNHAACAVDLSGFDIAADTEVVGAGLERHGAFLHGSVACALADAVDGAFDLVDTGFNARERVCNRHAEVVVHMAGQNDLLDAVGVLTQILDAGSVLLRNHVADGIRDVDGGSACLDCGLDYAAQEVEVGTGRVLGGELNVRAEALCVSDAVRDGLDYFVRGHLELVLHMYRAGCNKGMDTSGLGTADGVVGSLDILVYAARKRADGRAANGIRDGCDGCGVAGRSCPRRYPIARRVS